MPDFLFNSLLFLITYVGEVFGTIFGGGSFFIQPGMIALGIGAKVAVANDITAACFSAYAYLYDQRKALAEEYRKYLKIFLVMFPGILLGTFIGTRVLKAIPSEYVIWLIMFIATAGLIHMARQIRRKPASMEKVSTGSEIKHWQILSFLAAILLGFYDGMVGAGGGTLQILTFAILFRMAMKELILMAAIFSGFSLSLASINFLLIGLIDWGLLLYMVPAAILAGFSASWIVKLASERTLRIAFIAILTVLLLYLGYTEIIAPLLA
ncbi:MAG: sulfite exporter TauE/SafE family protein [Alphaproteobacteria bacterium]|nr:sulfite exporter TauE/SafE family protein [Alphaproteobacteria bacterium SS10]